MPQRTADLVALILAVTVALVTVLTALALLWLTLSGHPEGTSSAAGAIGDIVGVLIGALVGYMAGRSINGAHSE